MRLSRRHLLLGPAGLVTGLGLCLDKAAAQAAAPGGTDPALAARLQQGGVVAAFRHANAPGTFDPPGLDLARCSTQRNLDDAGRAQARRLGQWFVQQGLRPARVRTSPWCRCRDTATLAFGQADDWAALGSPRGVSEQAGAAHLAQLRQALQARRRQAGFEVWVTHMFVLSDLVATATASGEGLLLQAGPDGQPQVLGRIVVA